MSALRSVGFVVFLAAAFSCHRQPSPEKTAADDVILQEKERGPVKVTLRVEPKEPSFAERIRFNITTESEKGVEVRFPDPGATLSSSGPHLDPTRFIIRDYLKSSPLTTPQGRIVERQSYILEVVTSGEFTIPETTVSFVDRRSRDVVGDAPDSDSDSDSETEDGTADAADEKLFKILMDPIVINVKSLEDMSALEDLRPIEGPASPPLVPRSLQWPLIALAGIVGVVVIVVLVRRLARRTPRAAPPEAPEEIAYRELEWLLRQGYTDSGELVEFFFHLSRIVREYIERRFGLRAPERTTEEFLEELASSDALGSEHTTLLTHFLERADLVKFARYTPEADEISSSFEAARDFIARTRTVPDTRELARE